LYCRNNAVISVASADRGEGTVLHPVID
jgi:hypothetical protein